MNDNQPQFNTDAQRRALDVMSAKLLDNLNTMIAEQEARVKDFSLQAPANSSAEPETWYRTNTKEAKPPQDLVITYSDGANRGEVPNPRKKSVTPPPMPAQRKKEPEQTYRIPRPSLNRPVPTGKADGKENSVGCGKIAVIVVIIIILLRACS